MRTSLLCPLILTLTALGGTDLCLARIIDDFEDGDISDWFPSSSGVAQASHQAAFESSYGLELYDGSVLRDDEIAHVRLGGTLSCFTQLSGDVWARNYLSFGTSASGCYNVILEGNTDTFLIQYNHGYGYERLAEVPYPFMRLYWYFLEVNWATDGRITANLYESDMTTLLATVTAVHHAINGGGIMLQATAATPVAAYWDLIRFEEDPPSPVVCVHWGELKASFQ